LRAKELLLKQLHDVYSGDDEMSLQASLGDLSQAEASWRMNDTTWTIEEILFHVPPCEHPWGQRVFRVHDPDGHIVGVGEPIPAVIGRLLGGGMSAEAVAERTAVRLEIVEQIADG
jgi:hypothetical protein